MTPANREVVCAVYDLTVGADKYTTNMREIAAHLNDMALSTVQGRLERAKALGVITFEPTLANTIRLAEGITVHNGEVYRLQTL